MTILFVGHGGLPNGFSRVIQSLLKGLQGSYQLHHFAVNLGQPYRADGWLVHANPYLPELHSTRALKETLDRVRPDLVFILDEAWVCARYMAVLGGFKVVLYCAIDGEDAVPPAIAAAICKAGAVVVFTQFAKHIIECGACVVPHGIDTGTFFPIAGDGLIGFHQSRRRARAALFPDRPELDDAFIVLNANRNQPWKRIDLCIEGFAKFAEGKPSNVKLYLHMGTRRAPAGSSLVDRFGIRDRLLLTSESEHHPECSSEHLNLIYNACDVGVNTSEKEGWGLIAFEHGATGAAQIIPRHSVLPELWEGSALLVDTVGQTKNPLLGRMGHHVSAEGVSQALEKLCQDRDLRDHLALEAYRNATRPEYDWRNIIRQWDGLFQRLLRT